MPGDSALELLSPELQQKILLQTETLENLYTLIRSSPRLYQVFRLNRETTLSSIALCQFHPAVQSEALAIAKLAQLQRQSKRVTRSQRHVAVSFCDTFPTRIQHWCFSNDCGPVSVDLCKIGRTMKFFTSDYAQNTLPILDQLGHSRDLEFLPEYRAYNHGSYPQLSSTEIGRLQRAFCRFEIYRRLFSRCSQDPYHGAHNCIYPVPLTTTEQAQLFLQNLPAFQIAEIACIRDYLYRRLRGIFDELENEAVRTLPVAAMTFEEYDEDALWRSPFYPFTTHAQHEQGYHLEHLMSLGLPYIRQFLVSTGDEQRDLFLHHVRGYAIGHLENQFLSQAFECLGFNPSYNRNQKPWLDTGKDFIPACDENGYSELPQGWLWGHHKKPPIKAVNHVHKGLRDWGYVFWDYDRLQDSGILRRE